MRRVVCRFNSFFLKKSIFIFGLLGTQASHASPTKREFENYCEAFLAATKPTREIRNAFVSQNSYALFQTLSQQISKLRTFYDDLASKAPLARERLLLGKSPEEYLRDELYPYVHQVKKHLRGIYPELEIIDHHKTGAFFIRADKSLLQLYPNSSLIHTVITAQNLGMEAHFDPSQLVELSAHGFVRGKELHLSIKAVTIPFLETITEAHELTHARFRYDGLHGIDTPILSRWQSQKDNDAVSRTSYGSYFSGEEHYAFFETLKASERLLLQLRERLTKEAPHDGRQYLLKELVVTANIVKTSSEFFEALAMEKKRLIKSILDDLEKPDNERLFSISQKRNQGENSHWYQNEIVFEFFDKHGMPRFTHSFYSPERLSSASIRSHLQVSAQELRELEIEYLKTKHALADLLAELEQTFFRKTLQQTSEQLYSSPLTQARLLKRFPKIFRPHIRARQVYYFQNLNDQGQRLAELTYFLSYYGVSKKEIEKILLRSNWAELFHIPEQLLPLYAHQLIDPSNSIKTIVMDKIKEKEDQSKTPHLDLRSTEFKERLILLFFKPHSTSSDPSFDLFSDPTLSFLLSLSADIPGTEEISFFTQLKTLNIRTDRMVTFLKGLDEDSAVQFLNRLDLLRTHQSIALVFRL